MNRLDLQVTQLLAALPLQLLQVLLLQSLQSFRTMSP
jgi:hypothetical protein